MSDLIYKRGTAKDQMTHFLIMSTCTVQNSAQLLARISKVDEVYTKTAANPTTAEEIQAQEEEFLSERRTFDDMYFEAVTRARQLIQDA